MLLNTQGQILYHEEFWWAIVRRRLPIGAADMNIDKLRVSHYSRPVVRSIQAGGAQEKTSAETDASLQIFTQALCGKPIANGT